MTCYDPPPRQRLIRSTFFEIRTTASLPSPITTIASESRAQRCILVCQVEDVLRQRRSLNDASDLHSALILYQLSYSVE